MSDKTRIAVDAMGGDVGIDAVLPGCALALERRPDLTFLLFGDETAVNNALEGFPALKAVSKVHHSEVAIRMDDKPSQALRHGRRRSSMWMALEAVRHDEADVAVSAGNTGALMAMSKFALRTMANVDRPALAAVWPTMRGESIVLDLGATIGADAWQLVDFAVMGEAMAQALFGLKKPSIGLLNIGVEEVKGVEEVRTAGQLLREAGERIDYRGFVEGDDIGKGTVDVVVTEGFTGNIALKTAEGTAKQMAHFLRMSMSSSWLTRLGALLARSGFEQLKARMDPRRSNGAVFLGLNGIVVKSHGGTDAEGFAHAIDIGVEVVRFDLLNHIAKGLAAFRGKRGAMLAGDKE